ncbi:unnamed protein product, partial [Nesidiocoris tenuis]
MIVIKIHKTTETLGTYDTVKQKDCRISERILFPIFVMSLIHRIQKLLFTEYSDFEEHVLLECPFAQTTKDGFGIQQLQIG